MNLKKEESRHAFSKIPAGFFRLFFDGLALPVLQEISQYVTRKLLRADTLAKKEPIDLVKHPQPGLNASREEKLFGRRNSLTGKVKMSTLFIEDQTERISRKREILALIVGS
jgi:hypothetical protein